MLPALLTALFFAASGICGQRCAVWFGPLRGNALRLALAAVMLGVLTLLLCPVSLSTRTAHRLFYSGLVGFGVGDVALFLAYPRLGARLTLLVNLCSAPLFGAASDWMLTGAHVSMGQWLASGVILSGVVLALSGRLTLPHDGVHGVIPGLFAALVAGFGQGFGASLSRWAKLAATEEGLRFTGTNEAFIRVLPGLTFSVSLLALYSFWRRERKKRNRYVASKTANHSREGRGWPWLLGAALFGPVLGVSCFQWALGTAPSAIVLSITATTPILVMPLAYLSEGDSPSRLAIIGAAIAVSGVALMSVLAVV
jgi:drug/metabolite transporter (DMT)-like permease